MYLSKPQYVFSRQADDITVIFVAAKNKIYKQ